MGVVSYRRKNLYLWLLGLFCVIYIIHNEFSDPKCAQQKSASQSGISKSTQHSKLPNPRMISPLHQYPKVDFSENQRSTGENSGRVGIRLPGSDRVIDHHFPILFIGGVPRSGTTIMRVIADAHPSISCGEETRVVPQVILIIFQAGQRMVWQCYNLRFIWTKSLSKAAKYQKIYHEQLIELSETWRRYPGASDILAFRNNWLA